MPPPVGTPPSQGDKTRHNRVHLPASPEENDESDFCFLASSLDLSGLSIPLRDPVKMRRYFQRSRGRLSSLSYAPKKLTTKRLTPGRCARKSQGEACFRGYPWIDSTRRACGCGIDAQHKS
jgi:hypothetical protein